MVIYSVQWFYDSKLGKGKGKIPNKETYICFSVICRSSKDAVRCLDWHFNNEFFNEHKLSVDDGEIRLSRLTVDSRNFNARYLLMDTMREPICLSDLSSNYLRSSKIF